MARKKKRPELIHCKVRSQNHPTAPWRVSYKADRDGKRVTLRKSFGDEDDAWIFAQERDLEIVNHGLRYSDIPAEARRAFDYYRDQREEMIAEGMEVPGIEELIKNALEVVRSDFEAKAAQVVTVAEGVETFLDYKASRVGDRQLKDLQGRLKRYAQSFGDRAINSVTTTGIEKWLGGLRTKNNPKKLAVPPLLSPLARNHYRANLHSFFAYGAAPARGWTDRNPLTDLEPERVETSEPEAYSPEDAAKIMQTALDSKPELVPVLALGFFCGLRASEAQSIDLGKLPKDGGEFRVTGKTGPRMAPLTDAARAWLAAQPRRRGKASKLEERSFYNRVQELFKLAEVVKIDNGPRHSFISYRAAETRDVARVADEAGNSLATIKGHYRQIVTGDEAERFFAIRPETKAKNVTKIEEGRKRA